MGLWISQEIVKNHGSVIHFRSEGLGKGTTFFFALPMHVRDRQLGSTLHWESLSQPEQEPEHPGGLDNPSPARYSTMARQQGVDHPNRTASSHTTSVVVDSAVHALAEEDNSMVPAERTVALKVLVVDDSKANLKFLVRHLQQAAKQVQLQQPYKVALELGEEMDGTTAVARVSAAALEGRPFHMVFMDNTMTEMHGPEAAKIMRQRGFLGTILGVTGNVMQRDVADFIEAGADRIMAKPITTMDVMGNLQQTIAKILRDDERGDWPTIL